MQTNGFSPVNPAPVTFGAMKPKRWVVATASLLAGAGIAVPATMQFGPHKTDTVTVEKKVEVKVPGKEKIVTVEKQDPDADLKAPSDAHFTTGADGVFKPGPLNGRDVTQDAFLLDQDLLAAQPQGDLTQEQLDGYVKQTMDIYDQAAALAKQIGDKTPNREQAGQLGEWEKTLGQTRVKLGLYQKVATKILGDGGKLTGTMCSTGGDTPGLTPAVKGMLCQEVSGLTADTQKLLEKIQSTESLSEADNLRLATWLHTLNGIQAQVDKAAKAAQPAPAPQPQPLPQAKPTNLLVEGDSLSDTQAAGNYVWAGQVADALKASDVTTTNLAHKGDTLAQMKKQVADIPAAQDGKNNVAILWGGTNDLNNGTSTADTVKLLQDVTDAYKQKGYQVIVMTLPEGGKIKNKDFNDALRQSHGPWSEVIDVNQAQLKFGPDQIHIDGASQKKVAALVEKELPKFLQSLIGPALAAQGDPAADQPGIDGGKQAPIGQQIPAQGNPDGQPVR